MSPNIETRQRGEVGDGLEHSCDSLRPKPVVTARTDGCLTRSLTKCTCIFFNEGAVYGRKLVSLRALERTEDLCVETPHWLPARRLFPTLPPIVPIRPVQFGWRRLS